MKKKFKLLLVLVIAVLTLSMVGYAAWYITRDPQKVDGNVQAYAVDSNDITVELCDEDGDHVDTASINFAKPDGASNTDKWLQFGESDGDENLIVYFKVTTSKAATFTLNSTLKKGESPEEATTLFTGATFDVVDGSATITNDTTLSISAAGSVVISATYAWGLPSNPFTYFNDQSKDKVLSADEIAAANAILVTDLTTGAKLKDYAKNYLTDLDNKCNGLKFEITVTENHA